MFGETRVMVLMIEIVVMLIDVVGSRLSVVLSTPDTLENV